MKARVRPPSSGARTPKTMTSFRFVRGKARACHTATWRYRVRQRRELAQSTDRDLHDVGRPGPMVSELSGLRLPFMSTWSNRRGS